MTLGEYYEQYGFDSLVPYLNEIIKEDFDGDNTLWYFREKYDSLMFHKDTTICLEDEKKPHEIHDGIDVDCWLGFGYWGDFLNCALVTDGTLEGYARLATDCLVMADEYMLGHPLRFYWEQGAYGKLADRIARKIIDMRTNNQWRSYHRQRHIIPGRHYVETSHQWVSRISRPKFLPKRIKTTKHKFNRPKRMQLHRLEQRLEYLRHIEDIYGALRLIHVGGEPMPDAKDCFLTGQPFWVFRMCSRTWDAATRIDYIEESIRKYMSQEMIDIPNSFAHAKGIIRTYGYSSTPMSDEERRRLQKAFSIFKAPIEWREGNHGDPGASADILIYIVFYGYDNKPELR
ncbi:MAG: hypothetical protein IJ190_11575 [Prevotella sp.]|nr:hypothetical protein [Prevotella sp.]